MVEEKNMVGRLNLMGMEVLEDVGSGVLKMVCKNCRLTHCGPAVDFDTAKCSREQCSPFARGKE